jgi:hypothetical protein
MLARLEAGDSAESLRAVAGMAWVMGVATSTILMELKPW